ncbi:DMT family transporter [Pacificibacter marinus]|uniref:Riboflavin transporter n=1 Tax=Pacificibacter marinus TaxID=658057 RepID=A0A1Y5RFU9_9RHOB|nr:DMT family transporter [Pacificibacter marinus]SEK20863.1 S-adenosylmethionine uptake transporter [Pacificibacter marinus]SLN16569.1 Riboflavin transporter [Pacificibacter marinus]
MTRFYSTVSPAYVGASFMLIAGILFAVINTLVQYSTMILGLPPATVAFWQYLIALGFSVPWLLTKGIRAMKTSNPFIHVARVIMAAAGVQLWVMSLAHVPIWQAIALIMLSPFFVTFGAGVFLRETISFARWCAVIVGFIGGMIILAPWSEDFSVYALVAIAAAVMWALASLMTKYLTRTETPESLTTYLLLLLTPINAGLALSDGVSPSLGSAWVLLIAAGLMTALAQYALTKAYSSADAAYLQPFDHLKLPLNVGFGIVVFGFIPPGSMWIGSALIVAASFYLLRRETQTATN